MQEWSENNRACTTLWTTLFRMNQLFTSFDESGTLTMPDLTFFSPTDSASMRRQAATILADELDNIFIVGRGAKYEDGVAHDQAVAATIEILTDPEKKLADLALAVDANYLFWGEPHRLA
jgi:hypothetical protein